MSTAKVILALPLRCLGYEAASIEFMVNTSKPAQSTYVVWYLLEAAGLSCITLGPIHLAFTAIFHSCPLGCLSRALYNKTAAAVHFVCFGDLFGSRCGRGGEMFVAALKMFSANWNITSVYMLGVKQRHTSQCIWGIFIHLDCCVEGPVHIILIRHISIVLNCMLGHFVSIFGWWKFTH